MRKNYFSKTFLLIAFSVLAALPAVAQTFTNGVFVLNEGGFGSNNASVSFLENGAAAATNDIYTTVNPTQEALGDTAQSIGFSGTYAYIVLNYSNTVKIVNRYTFEYVATINQGLLNPRYIAFHGDKAYVTNWGDGASTTDDYVAVIDLATNTITRNIPAAEGVERIITYNDKLYVAHYGGYGYGNTVSVIDTETDTIETIIPVGDVPNKLVVKDGFLYVLCGGNPGWSSEETDGELVKINLADDTVTAKITYEGQHPGNLEIDADDNFYFSNEAKVYKGQLSDNETVTEIATLEPQGAYGIYSMALINNTLYVADAGDYVSPGTVYVFDTAGAAVSNYTVGVIPNGFYKAESNLATPGFDKQALAVYPNPTTERFFVNTTATPQISVYDITGKMVLNTQYAATGVSIANLPQGMYMVKIADNTTNTVKKLIIK